jgi:hypothetical protein
MNLRRIWQEWHRNSYFNVIMMFHGDSDGPWILTGTIHPIGYKQELKCVPACSRSPCSLHLLQPTWACWGARKTRRVTYIFMWWNPAPYLSWLKLAHQVGLPIPPTVRLGRGSWAKHPPPPRQWRPVWGTVYQPGPARISRQAQMMRLGAMKWMRNDMALLLQTPARRLSVLLQRMQGIQLHGPQLMAPNHAYDCHPSQ